MKSLSALACVALMVCLTASVAASMRRVAVVELRNSGGVSDAEAYYLTDLVRAKARAVLPSARYMVLTRENILELLPPEMDMGRCDSAQCEIEMGRMMGADIVVSGELLKFGGEYRVIIKAHAVENGDLISAEKAGGETIEAIEAPLENVSLGLFLKVAGRASRSETVTDLREGEIGERPATGWDIPTDQETLVTFESDPEGAVVMINGRLLCRSAPCSRLMPIGPMLVSMQREGYLFREEPVEVRAKGRPIIHWSLEPDFGWLTVTSGPPGLSVMINDHVAGVTPLVEMELLPGVYEVLVTDPRYYDQGERIILKRGEEETVSVDLVPRLGAVRVTAADRSGEPAAGHLYIDGRRAGPVPGTYRVVIGVHELRVLTGAGEWSGRVEVAEREVEEVSARMVVKSVVSKPRKAVRHVPTIEMVEIPAGRFVMGSPRTEAGRQRDEIGHEVVIDRPFLAARHEVTRGLWRDVMGAGIVRNDECGDDCPVEQVSWYDAVTFCNRLSARAGLTPAYRIRGREISWNADADGYRLPTEAEWEYACRAGTSTTFFTGASKADLDIAGWFGSNSGRRVHPAGGKASNPWGLYDMHGNVSEWCWDWYGGYPEETVTDPVGPPSGSRRVSRGGSWFDMARICRSAARGGASPDRINGSLGLRLFRFE